MAKTGDRYLATSGDFFMATDRSLTVTTDIPGTHFPRARLGAYDAVSHRHRRPPIGMK